ncbi:hypothetical protein E2320_006807, partial [Naja naja]
GRFSQQPSTGLELQPAGHQHEARCSSSQCLKAPTTITVTLRGQASRAATLGQTTVAAAQAQLEEQTQLLLPPPQLPQVADNAAGNLACSAPSPIPPSKRLPQLDLGKTQSTERLPADPPSQPSSTVSLSV